ncbi:MAG: peptidase domain-containing ABC transporter [Cyanomargarita calcarea GSE-NOS-MK-12-04C]|jgi:ATP-binding cassette subfamily B protein|uniref:Peptidase domain-containing ABC transporter n=1 Tax=Cyanomargarita calcarea GSE-NOS-MK-12-04C TaxID=2839659 RepID=A0A951QNZ8_9CYAN|nr:peptidase domain-containing ABC transporter [Cyanomargarita calcarea GSE-NOS-MK-12-04C]
MQTKLSQEELTQKLSKILGQELSEQEIQDYLALAEIVEPSATKQFWSTSEAQEGIYVVLAGKVRLLDREENLITSLSVESSFGEASLFPREDFHPYAARSSTNLKLLYLKQEMLQKLIDLYPTIGECLLQRAEIWDLVMLYRQNLQLQTQPSDIPGILQALSVFERHNLGPGEETSLPKDSKFLLLQKGELQDSEGRILAPGKIYPLQKPGCWQVRQPTVAYILLHANVQIAKQNWQQLGEFVKPQEQKEQKTQKNKSKPERLSPTSNIIPFPQRESSPKPKRSQPYFPSPKVRVGQMWVRATKTYPFYAQQSAADCGAACLVMIGRYWGKQFSVNRLREQANVSRSGASLKALAAAAESLGFTTRPIKASLDKLVEQPLPAIAHWEGKHYIVVYKITKKQVIVGDPAIGQRSLTHAQFNQGWTGYTLLVQPTAMLKQAEETETSLWQFFELVRPHSKVLLEVFLASVLIQLFGLITPLFTQLLLDKVIVQGSTITLNAVGFGLLIFGLFRIIVNSVRQYLLDHTANRVSVAMLVGFIRHTFSLPLSFFESRYVGDIVSRIQENHKIQRFLTGEALSICLDLLTVFIYVGLMFCYNWQMALLVLSIVPPFFLLALFSTGILRRLSREIFTAGANENSYLIQSLSGIRSVRSMAIEQTVRWRWEELLNKLIKKSFRSQIVANRLQIISATIETLISTGLLWYGASLVIQNQLTIGQLIAFNMLLGNVIHPFQRLSVLWNQLQEVLVSAERINDVLGAEPEENLLTSPRQSLRKFRGQIRFEGVTFRYHPESETNVLENLSFEIQSEQSVAVVGRSGSGKTTLSKLILGLYPPTSGKVLIDGHDVTSISLKSLRSQIGLVDQDTFLFGGTIRENLSIAHPEASLEEIIEAARLAGADDFIQKLPMGYETPIGEGGGMLSGGQRQRLAIARALLGDPRFLIFDEATSNLDAESERIIQNNLNTILKKRSSLIIAHRLSTVRNADLILVLDKGVLIEKGTHDELIAKKGHYYYLNQQQLAQTA